MSDIITLSSSDEEASPAKKSRTPLLPDLKGITITPVPKNGKTKRKKPRSKSQENVVVVSDDDSSVTFDMNEITISRYTVKEPTEVSDNLVVIDDNEDSEAIFIKNYKEKQNISKIVDDNFQDDCQIIEESENKCQDEKKNGTLKNNFDKENISQNIAECSGSLKEDDRSVLKDSESLLNDNGIEIDTINHSGSRPSTSTGNADIKAPQTVLLETFVSICEESVKGSRYSKVIEKIPVLWKFYRKCECSLGDSGNFKSLLEQNIERARQSMARSVIAFQEVFQYIKEVVNSESIEVSEDVRIRLRKFDKAIKLLTKRIHQLENAEVNFDDEEDSTYIQLDRYYNRLKKIYHKYCQLTKKNPQQGRITYAKLDFVASDYNEINIAICKKYKNNQKFPSFYELHQFIKKIDKQHNLHLSDARIYSESRLCFEKLGELLQNRRKKELYDNHYYFIKDNNDPAVGDTSLNDQLKRNFEEGQKKIGKVCQEYVQKQECGEEAVEPDLSEDSDQSNYIDSEEEDKNEQNEAENQQENVN